jgi:hypothetical protein
MNKIQEIKINGMRQDIDAWRRYIHFNKDGIDYELILFWDQFDGYEIMWGSASDTKLSKAPEWADNWDEDDHEGMSLGHYLDDLTYEMVAN